MVTVTLVLVGAAAGKVPLWIAVLLLALVEFLHLMPVR